MLVGCTALKIGNTHTGTRMAVGIVAMMHMSAACCSSLMCHQIGRQTEYFRMMMMRENLSNQHQHADCQQKYDLNSLFIIILYQLIISSFFITVIFGYRCGDEVPYRRAPSISTTSKVNPFHWSVSPLVGMCCNSFSSKPPNV